MKKFDNKSGFTLIEIIVVLIIVGILAAIALPNLFNNVTSSRASAALASVDGYKSQIESCLQSGKGTKTATNAASAPNDCSLPILALPTAQNGVSIDETASGGSLAAGTFTYAVTGIVNGTTAFTLSRSGNGTFACAPGAAGTPYTNVC